MTRLETNRALAEAIILYRSAGYQEVPAFSADPYAHHWFVKTLRQNAPEDAGCCDPGTSPSHGSDN